MMSRWLPMIVLGGLSRYFRLKVTGITHVPAQGACLIVANHSGFAGLDALLLYHSIKKNRKRVPRVLAHKLWFVSRLTKKAMYEMGFFEASMKRGLELLQENHALMLFPEGEAGNFKPSSQMYQLQPFKSGMVRLALQTGAPIVPVLITGAEEASINLKQLKLPSYLNKLLLPLPMNILPLPVRWHIHFLQRIDLPYGPDRADDKHLVDEITEDIQDQMQEALLDIFLKKGGKR